MSLFSRIDRLRGGGGRGEDRDDDSVFAIPDLRRSSEAAQVAPPSEEDEAAPTSSPAPARTEVRFQPSERSQVAPIADEVAPRTEAAPRAEAAPRTEAAPRIESTPSPEPVEKPRREGVPVPPMAAANGAKKKMSPLERLARRSSELEEEPQSSSLGDPVVGDRPASSGLAGRLRAEPLPDVAAPVAPPTQRLAAEEAESQPAASEEVPAPRTPFRRATLFNAPEIRSEVPTPESLPDPVSSMEREQAAPEVPRKPRESAAERMARDEREGQGAFSPESLQEIEAKTKPQDETLPSISSSATPAVPTSGGTAFDRLMAARAGNEARPSAEKPRSSAPSLAERLAAMRAQTEAQSELRVESPAQRESDATLEADPDDVVSPTAEAITAEVTIPEAVTAEVAPSVEDFSPAPVGPDAPVFQTPVLDPEARLEEVLPPVEEETASHTFASVAPFIEPPVEHLEAEELPATEAAVVAEPVRATVEEARIELPASSLDAPVAPMTKTQPEPEVLAAVTPEPEAELVAQPEPEAELVAQPEPEAAVKPEPEAAVKPEPVFQESPSQPELQVQFQSPMQPKPQVQPEFQAPSRVVEDAPPAAPPLPWNTVQPEDAREEPMEEKLTTPAAAVPASTVAPQTPPSLWAQRLAGRDALRDAPVPTPERPTPTLMDLSTPGVPTEALDRAAGQLARAGGEGVSGEGEARNRSLYRQKHFIFDAVLGALDARTLQNATRESVKTPVERAVDAAIREFNLSLDNVDRNWMAEEFVREVVDLGPLVGLLDDVTVGKVLVVGSTDVAVERFGRIERTGVSFRDDDHLLSVVRRIADMTGGRVDAKVPLLDRPLPDGARIRAKIPPLSPQPTLTIEKSTGNPFLALKRQQAERGRENALPYSQLRERIQQRLLREFEGNAAALGNHERLRTQVEEMIGLVIAEEKVAVTRAERASLVMDLLNEIVGLGPIEPLLNDPEVDEIMVNGPFQIYVERKGKLEIAPQRFRDNNHVMQVIERIIAPLGRRVDEKSPMVDGRLRDGSRFNAVIPPLALGGPTMTIRKFARDPFTMTDLINFGSLSREAAQFLQAAVEGRMNIIVSGGTGSGKTTTLNVLSSFIPSTERIVTIEDAAELQLRQEHIVRLETRPPNIEGAGEIAIRDLVRNSLRMRPDRIVVGECRGGEALDMLQAMNTGHDGSLTTAHSNGPRDTIKRLETMVMMAGFDLPVRAIREQISMAVQFVVHQERMRDGKRRVTAITELVGMEGEVVTMQDIFRFEQDRVDEEGRIIGSLVSTGLRPHNFDNMVDNGGQLSMDLFQPRNMGGRDGDLRSRLSEHRVGTR